MLYRILFPKGWPLGSYIFPLETVLKLKMWEAWGIWKKLLPDLLKGWKEVINHPCPSLSSTYFLKMDTKCVLLKTWAVNTRKGGRSASDVPVSMIPLVAIWIVCCVMEPVIIRDQRYWIEALVVWDWFLVLQVTVHTKAQQLQVHVSYCETLFSLSAPRWLLFGLSLAIGRLIVRAARPNQLPWLEENYWQVQ